MVSGAFGYVNVTANAFTTRFGALSANLSSQRTAAPLDDVEKSHRSIHAEANWIRIYGRVENQWGLHQRRSKFAVRFAKYERYRESCTH